MTQVEDQTDKTADVADIPPTEPVQQPTKKRGPGRPRKQRSTGHHVQPDDLLPPTIKTPPPAAFVYYWVGVIDDCPLEFPTIAGISFPKHTQRIEYDPKQQRKVRSPRTGTITKLTRDQFDRLADKLRRTVVRIFDAPQRRDEDAEAPPIPKRAHLISIPSDEELATLRKQGMAVNNYVPRPGDQPATAFFYCIPCEDQSAPEPEGRFYPDPIAKTGLVWPGDE